MNKHMLATLLLGMAVSGAALAAPLIYEPFDYNAGDLDGKGGTAEVGLEGTWSANVSTKVVEDSLGAEYIPVRGGSIGGLSASVNRFGGSRAISASALADQGLLDDGSDLWFSVVMGLGTGGNIANARLAFALANSTFHTDNYNYSIMNEGEQLGSGIGVSLGKIDGTSGGVGKVCATRFQDPSFGNGIKSNVFGDLNGSAYAAGESGLIVCKITWGATDADGDIIEVYQPDTELNLGEPVSALTTVVDQSTFDTITFARGDVVVMDEIHFGSSYESVLETAMPETDPIILNPSDIVNDKSGGTVFVGEGVIYTMTFGEQLDGDTVTADDFENAGTAGISFMSVEVSSNIVTAIVIPETVGTLILQVKAGAVISDFVGNDLDTTSPITDDTTLNVVDGILEPSTMITSVTSGGYWGDDIDWNNGVPGIGYDAIIGSGIHGDAWGITDPWIGNLILESDARLHVFTWAESPYNILAQATTITLNNAEIRTLFKTITIPGDIILNGGGTLSVSGVEIYPGSTVNYTAYGYFQGHTYSGDISGHGGLNIYGANGMGVFINGSNTFTGGLVLGAERRYGVQFNAAGAAGAGNVTVNSAMNSAESAAILLGADDVFASTAVLTLNGKGWNNTTGGIYSYGTMMNDAFAGNSVRIDMATFNATVGELWIDGVQMATGTYTGTDGDWIAGTGVLTVSGESNSYANWLENYPESDLSNPDADLDGDGLSNHEECVWGTDPTSGLSCTPYAIPLDSATGTFSYTRRDPALSGLTYTVRTCTNLSMGDWSEDTGAVLVTGTPDENDVETVAVTLSSSRLGKTLFIQIQATE